MLFLLIFPVACQPFDAWQQSSQLSWLVDEQRQVLRADPIILTCKTKVYQWRCFIPCPAVQAKYWLYLHGYHLSV